MRNGTLTVDTYVERYSTGANIQTIDQLVNMLGKAWYMNSATTWA